MATRSASTTRLYARAQSYFTTWCSERGLTNPTLGDIAEYLRYCARTFGPSTPPVHLSAIAKMYRDMGFPFDTRVEPIRAVMTELRANAKKKSTRR